jgi:hypothetical protein
MRISITSRPSSKFSSGARWSRKQRTKWRFYLVAVLRRLVADHGHEALLVVLLLHQVLAGAARDAAAEEELAAAVQRVVGK